MSSEVADNNRRRFLTAATVVVGAVGTVAGCGGGSICKKLEPQRTGKIRRRAS
jgi:hypothetical protein